MDVTPLFLSRKCSKRSLYHVGKWGNLLRPIVLAETAGKPPKTAENRKTAKSKKVVCGIFFILYIEYICQKSLLLVHK